MRRTTWFAVLITTVVLAIASIIPWMSSTPKTTVRPTVRTGHGPVAKATTGPIARERSSSAAAARATGSLRDEDQELVRVAVRGGLIGLGAATLAVVIGWSIATRGGVRRRVITLAGRGLPTVDVARRTGMSQDAVRTLLIPEASARRRRGAA